MVLCIKVALNHDRGIFVFYENKQNLDHNNSLARYEISMRIFSEETNVKFNNRFDRLYVSLIQGLCWETD